VECAGVRDSRRRVLAQKHLSRSWLERLSGHNAPPNVRARTQTAFRSRTTMVPHGLARQRAATEQCFGCSKEHLSRLAWLGAAGSGYNRIRLQECSKAYVPQDSAFCFRMRTSHGLVECAPGYAMVEGVFWHVQRAFESAGGLERLGVARTTSECKENAQKAYVQRTAHLLRTTTQHGLRRRAGHAIAEGVFWHVQKSI
jgi:hypothetical protein